MAPGLSRYPRSCFYLAPALSNFRGSLHTILIPPRRGARIWHHGHSQAERLQRDENLRSIRQHGRKDWKKKAGYHVRSLAETTMFRLKTIFSDSLSARRLETQTTQALVRCAALNKMTPLGMPQSYKVA